MWRHHQIHAFLYLYLGAIIWIHEITTTASRGMTTFKTESMRIRAPKRSNDGNVFEEAFQLIKQHFIDRSRYSENEWKKLKREYGSIPDPHEAIRRFLRTFSDPYTTFYEPTTMVHKSEVLRGEKVTLGLSLGRKWNFSNLGQLRVSIKDSFKRVFSSDFSVIIQHKMTLCKYTAASLTLMPGVSIHISNQLMKYTKGISPNLVRRFCIGAYGCMIGADVISKIVNVCCDVVVTECTGRAVISGIKVGDKVIGFYDGNYCESVHPGGTATPRQSIRYMRKVIESGPIDQFVYVDVIRHNVSTSEGVQGEPCNDKNGKVTMKCARDYR